MSYKEQLKDEIESILHHNPKQDAILRIFNNVYTQALEESKKTGHSISSITYEILEGLEESQPHHASLESHLSGASVLISIIIYESAKEKIDKQEKELEQIKAKLIDTIESEIFHLLESLETCNAYATDNNHNNFKQSLSKAKSDILDRVNAFKVLLTKYHTP